VLRLSFLHENFVDELLKASSPGTIPVTVILKYFWVEKFVDISKNSRGCRMSRRKTNEIHILCILHQAQAAIITI
jgi:hypothetical protein